MSLMLEHLAAIVLILEHCYVFHLDRLLALATNVRLPRKKLTRTKHSSLLCHTVSDEERQFDEIDTWCQCYKTFFLHC
jgi:hypothetical protein